MKNRFAIVAGLGVAVLAGGLYPAISVGNAHAAASLSSFALKKSDVPAGYKQTTNEVYTIQSQAKSSQVSVATLRSKGWVASYESTFEKAAKTAAIEIDSSIDQYKSSSGVTWDLSNGLKVLKKELPGAKTFSVSGFTDPALGLKASGKQGKTPYAVIFIVIRHGSYLGAAGVYTAGKAAPPTLAQAKHYASIVEGRLKNA